MVATAQGGRFDPPNFLVLDEPTNHLDLGAKEDVGARREGYDCMFLRGLGSRVLEPGGESGADRRPAVYPGS